MCVPCCVLSGNSDHRNSMQPCARDPCVITTPGQRVSSPGQAKPHCLSWCSELPGPTCPSCVLVASVCDHVLLWGHMLPMSLCLSHPRAVLCSFSPSSHCSLQCCAPKPRTRGLPVAPAWAEALSQREELPPPGTV